LSQLRAFIDEHERAVVKPLDQMAGKSVFVTGAQDPNRNVVLETLSDFGSRYVMAQMYIPEIVESGDKRILLIDGNPVPYALVRFPPAGDHRGNISTGAITDCQPLTSGEQRICDTVGPVMRERGLLFAGLDVIGDYLTEINITSPTGIRELDRARPLHIAEQLLDAIESRLEEIG
jgi:glutathione synthase